MGGALYLGLPYALLQLVDLPLHHVLAPQDVGQTFTQLFLEGKQMM